MFKFVMSDKKVMSTFLKRVLNTKVNNISIVDKSSGRKLTPIIRVVRIPILCNITIIKSTY